jgi:hypothetical protein
VVYVNGKQQFEHVKKSSICVWSAYAKLEETNYCMENLYPQLTLMGILQGEQHSKLWTLIKVKK